MRRHGLLLGLYSAGAQILLLRELISSLNGDELFIATALFGWLTAVAVGAFVGGQYLSRVRPVVLFVPGVLLLPALIVAVRLSPLVVSNIVGEVIPFTTACALSMLAMCPAGLISGWLFATITSPPQPAAGSIVAVYLYEGIGAFIGGVAITLCAGRILSTLAVSIAMGAVVSAGVASIRGGSPARVVSVACLAIGAVAVAATPRLDRYLDSVKYPSYNLIQSLDTHYGHEAILERDSSRVLMTDNTVEAVDPDLENAENLLIVPLIYSGGASDALLLGRAEFGVAQLASSFPGLEITQVDPRAKLTQVVDRGATAPGNLRRVDRDAVSYMSAKDGAGEFDFIIINTGEPNSYQTNRFYTSSFFLSAKRRLKPGGLVFLPAHYDSDRYLSPEKKKLLSVIHRTLSETFANTAFWPGNMTLFLASDDRSFDLSYDSVMSRLEGLGVSTQYINADYLFDRLSPMKTERLRDAFGLYHAVNRLEKPVLPHYQLLYRAKANRMSKRLFELVLDKPLWIWAVPALIVLLFLIALLLHRTRSTYPLVLYLTAGLVSLSLELISFYLYQSTVGSLYSELALLIGSFMLGLSAGTYYSRTLGNRRLEYPALLVLLLATLTFLGAWHAVGPQWALCFHVLFLFVVAVATGALFVAATNAYYSGRRDANRGLGYTCEVAGSSLAALVTTTIFLPVIGLQWLLASLAVLIAVAFGGAVLAGRG